MIHNDNQKTFCYLWPSLFPPWCLEPLHKSSLPFILGENKLSKCVCAKLQRTVTVKTLGFRPSAERTKKLSVENTWSRHIPQMKSEKRLSNAVAKNFTINMYNFIMKHTFRIKFGLFYFTSTLLFSIQVRLLHLEKILGVQQSKIKENRCVVRQVFFSVYFKTFISKTSPTTCSFWHYLRNWSSLWPKSLQAHITDRSLVKHKRSCVLSSCSLSIFVAG